MNDRAKVLVITGWYPSRFPSIDGVFVREQVRTLRDRFDVAVLHLIGFSEFSRLWKRAHGSSRSVKSDPPLWSAVIPVPRPVGAPFYAAVSLTGRFMFRRILRSWGKPDLLHGQVAEPGGWATIAIANRHRLPVVLTEHSNPAMHCTTPIHERHYRRVLRRSDRIIAVSPYLETLLRSYLDSPRPIDLVGNVVRRERFRTASSKTGDPFRFVAIGHLTANKAFDLLLRAVDLLASQGRAEFELTIAGDGPLKEQLLTMIRSLGLTSVVRLIGRVHAERIPDLIQDHDALVSSSLSETFGLVLAEAMACGKPVVASNSGGSEFVVTPETGILVDRDSAEALAEGMGSLLDGKVTFDSDVIRSSVEHRFGEEAFLQKMERIYESVRT